jgi:membrane-associated protease RseP (regulator of RpoE activity)
MDDSPALRPYRRDPQRLWLHAGLLLATFLTATMAGSWVWEGTFDGGASWRALVDVARLSRGVTYASLLLLILGAHEMGHYLACRYYGVPATLPFFIPGPPMLVGTLGAVIRIRGVIPSRKALFDIAAAGPIAGFVVALPLLILGVARATELPESTELHGLTLGPPLCSWIFEHLFHGDAPLQVGSIYGAAWVGMLVTSMNLFPVGQLDGGHALFAVAPRLHRLVSWVTIAAVGALVVVQSVVLRTPSAYTLWLVILVLMRGRHPRLFDESDALGPTRRTLAVALVVIFILTFIPMPLVLD